MLGSQTAICICTLLSSIMLQSLPITLLQTILSCVCVCVCNVSFTTLMSIYLCIARDSIVIWPLENVLNQ